FAPVSFSNSGIRSLMVSVHTWFASVTRMVVPSMLSPSSMPLSELHATSDAATTAVVATAKTRAADDPYFTVTPIRDRAPSSRPAADAPIHLPSDRMLNLFVIHIKLCDPKDMIGA